MNEMITTFVAFAVAGLIGLSITKAGASRIPVRIAQRQQRQHRMRHRI